MKKIKDYSGSGIITIEKGSHIRFLVLDDEVWFNEQDLRSAIELSSKHFTKEGCATFGSSQYIDWESVSRCLMSSLDQNAPVYLNYLIQFILKDNSARSGRFSQFELTDEFEC